MFYPSGEHENEKGERIFRPLDHPAIRENEKIPILAAYRCVKDKRRERKKKRRRRDSLLLSRSIRGGRVA